MKPDGSAGKEGGRLITFLTTPGLLISEKWKVESEQKWKVELLRCYSLSTFHLPLSVLLHRERCRCCAASALTIIRSRYTHGVLPFWIFGRDFVTPCRISA
jgi:hypothetical protein